MLDKEEDEQKQVRKKVDDELWEWAWWTEMYLHDKCPCLYDFIDILDNTVEMSLLTNIINFPGCKAF